MAKSDTRRKTTRTAVDLGGPASPRLEQQRHFSMRPDRTGERNAEALRSAFATGIDAYTAKLGRDNEEARKTALTEAGAGGSRREDEASIAYQRAWDKLDDQRSLQKATTGLPAFLTDNNAENMTEEERQKLINAWMENKHKGLDDEAERRGYGRDRSYLSEGLLELEATEMLKYRDMDLQRLRAENNSESFAAMRDHYMMNEGELDYKLWMERTDEFNEGADKSQTFWEGLFSLARETGDMSILANVPERFPNGDPTHLNNPAFQAALEQAKSQTAATYSSNMKAAEASYQATHQTQLALQHSRDKQLAKSGDPQVLENIAMGGVPGPNGEPPRYKKGEQTALYDSYFNVVAENASTAGMVKDFSDGNLLDATTEEYDRAFEGYIAAVEENLVSDGEMSPEEIQAALVKVGIERSVVNGRFPKVLIDRMMVNIRNPAKFKQAAEFYDQAEAQLPGFTETQIGDKQAMLFDTYRRLLEDTGSEQGAIAALERYEYGRHNSDEFKDDIGDTIDSATSAVADKPWSAFNYDQTARLKARVALQIKHYVDMGYDLDEAEDFAVTAIERRSIRAGNHLYEVDAGWGADPTAEYEWAIENAAAHAGVDPESIRIVPHPRDPKKVLIENTESVIPGSGEELSIIQISANHKRWTDEQEVAQIEASKIKSDEEVAIARERAFERMYPTNPYGKPGDRAAIRASQKRQWAALPMSERNRLIRQEFVTPE